MTQEKTITRHEAGPAYLSMAGSLYLLTRAEGQVDIDKALADYYREKEISLRMKLTQEATEQLEKEFEKQAEHIAGLKNRRTISLPEELKEETVFYMGRERSFYLVRPVVYRPEVYHVSTRTLSDIINEEDRAPRGDDETIFEVIISGAPVFSGFVGFRWPEFDLVATIGFSTFHSYDNIGEKTIFCHYCTGNATPLQWYKMSAGAIEEQLKVTNCFSMARSFCAGRDGKNNLEHWQVNNLLRRGKVVSWKEYRPESKWQVTRRRTEGRVIR